MNHDIFLCDLSKLKFILGLTMYYNANSAKREKYLAKDKKT
jgi:hypothetical protein